jgi:hypothetical protein
MMQLLDKAMRGHRSSGIDSIPWNVVDSPVLDYIVGILLLSQEKPSTLMLQFSYFYTASHNTTLLGKRLMIYTLN